MQEIHVVAGVVWQNGRFLAARRPEGTRFAGYWEFPGGKIEPGETQSQALVREFIEEMSITPLHWEFWQVVQHTYPELTVYLYFFHITKFEGVVYPAEGHEIAWLTHAEAVTLPFLEADISVVEALKHCAFAADGGQK